MATYKNITAVTTTALTDIFTATADTFVIQFRATNKTGTTDNLTIKLIPASGTAVFVVYQLSIPGSATVKLIDDKLVLKSGDKLQIQSSTANSIDILGSAVSV